MNASAYLKTQGWRGDGFSLDQSNRGLARPLRISHKVDQLGLGKKKDDFTNQWWLNAFDKSLDAFGSGEAVPEFNPRNIARKNALYSNFVKAETLASTLGVLLATSSPSTEKENRPIATDTPINGAVHSSIPSNDSPVDGASTAPKLKPVKKLSRKEEKKLRGEKRRAKKERKSDKVENYERRKVEKMNTAETEFHIEGQTQEEKLHAVSQAQTNRKRKLDDDDENDSSSDSSASSGSDDSNSDSGREKKLKTSQAFEDADAVLEKHKKIRLSTADGERKAAEVLQEETGQIHPESITALRSEGEVLEIPGDLRDVTPLGQVIRAFEKQNKRLIKQILAATWPTPSPINEKELRRQGLPIVKPSKKDKHRHESYKRMLKRAARHWVAVRQHPGLYRPNATSVSRPSNYDPFEEIEDRSKKKQNKKKDMKPIATGEDQQRTRDERERARAERQARRQLRSEMQAEKRAAKKLIRSERKRLNHEKVQQHIAANVRQKKENKERTEAAQMGISYENFLAERKAKQATERITRDTERAKSLGITYEELVEQLRKEHAARAAENERRKA